MGSAPSKRVEEPAPPKRKRAARTKKNKPTQTNALNTENVNSNKNTVDPDNGKNENDKNIRGSPSIQLKRIIDLVTSKNTDYDAMDLNDTQKLLKQIRRLSSAK